MGRGAAGLGDRSATAMRDLPHSTPGPRLGWSRALRNPKRGGDLQLPRGAGVGGSPGGGGRRDRFTGSPRLRASKTASKLCGKQRGCGGRRTLPLAAHFTKELNPARTSGSAEGAAPMPTRQSARTLATRKSLVAAAVSPCCLAWRAASLYSCCRLRSDSSGPGLLGPADGAAHAPPPVSSCEPRQSPRRWGTKARQTSTGPSALGQSLCDNFVSPFLLIAI